MPRTDERKEVDANRAASARAVEEQKRQREETWHQHLLQAQFDRNTRKEEEVQRQSRTRNRTGTVGTTVVGVDFKCRMNDVVSRNQARRKDM